MKVKVETQEETIVGYLTEIELLQDSIANLESSDTLIKEKYRVTLEKDGKKYAYLLNNLKDIKFLER